MIEDFKPKKFNLLLLIYAFSISLIILFVPIDYIGHVLIINAVLTMILLALNNKK